MAAVSEELVQLGKGTGEIALAAGLHGFGQDRVGIVVIKNHDVLGTAAGGMRKSTGLIAQHAAKNRHPFRKHKMDLDVGIVRDGRRCHDVWWWNGGGGGRRFSGADVLAIFAEMDFAVVRDLVRCLRTRSEVRLGQVVK